MPNPYRHSLSYLLKRLIWDIKLNSWVSRARLRRLKNKFSDKKALILCNGPSLSSVTAECLDGYFVIGLNKINLFPKFDELSLDMIVSVNPHVIRQNLEFYNQCDVPMCLGSNGLSTFGLDNPNITWLHCCDIPSFSGDVSASVFEGYTVTYVALQLAFHMGFKGVGLLGCDHDYPDYGVAPNQLVCLNEPDTAHFCDSYFRPDQEFQSPDLMASEYFYGLAARNYAGAGRYLFNLTKGSKLQSIPKSNLYHFSEI